MNFDDAWQFLDNLQFFKIKLGLDSMTAFLEGLGSPERGLRFVHIAGTNGKGSVAVTLLELLARSGYRVGLYTSPHLSSVRERFRINDRFISRTEFAAEANRIIEIINGRQITYFEFTTALALLWFARQQVDLVLFEVGLGGRLDATNVITPLVSIITNVSMDHEAYLGNTIREIAHEKAGIIKPGIPVVTGAGSDSSRIETESLAVLEETARSRQAPLFQLGRDFLAEPADDHTWTYWKMARQGCCQLRKTIPGLACRLKGRHQQQNAALALAAVELLCPHGFTISDETIRQGLAAVNWPGRLEHFYYNAAKNQAVATDDACSHQFLLDGAHNPAGVVSLGQALANDFSYHRLILLWGAMADKDLAATLPAIAPLADAIILTRPAGERAATPAHLFSLLSEDDQAKTQCCDRVAEGLHAAMAVAGPDDLVCVSGSLYLIGEVRKILLGELADG